MSRRLAAASVAAALCLSVALPARQSPGGAAVGARIVPTAHPPVPSALGAMWYVPPPDRPVPASSTTLSRAVSLLEDDSNPRAAVPLLEESVRTAGPLADQARLYLGRALNLLGRFDEAEAVLAIVTARPLEGALPDDAAFALAEARSGRGDFAGAAAVYERLAAGSAAPHLAAWRLAEAAERAGETARAIAAYERVYFEYPLSTEADLARDALDRLGAWGDEATDAARELARADALFAARRWSAAQASYRRARAGVTPADRRRVDLRVAACDVSLNRARQARDALRGFLDGPLAEEAGFHYVAALRAIDAAEHIREARRFVDRHRSGPYAEEVLNGLATHFIVANQDERADEVFRQVIEWYPSGRFAERAYWRSGWWAYRDRRYAEAARLFDAGAERFPRSDYRPAWLYWSGRAWRRASREDLAVARLSVALTDYHNSYYGRLARGHLTPGQAGAVASRFARLDAPPPAPFPTAARVADLIAAGLFRAAVAELQHAQRAWGDSPALTATLALAQHRAGNLRAGINAMKRAYPQWMAAGGEALPREMQEVVFPLDYWPLISRHATARGLDPYLIAALVAQESTFDPVIRSSANAVGLMQVLPSTGGQFARALKMTGFTPARLTDPETNVRLGTAIFAQALSRFGGVHYALAAYNAGEHRVATWKRDRPDLPQDEFIDDIPFPETQNYVKRILGTAEDYRRLYGAR